MESNLDDNDYIHGDDEKDNSKLSSLLEEFSKLRKDIYGMIEQLEVVRQNIERLFPDKLEYRNKYILEEKMKAVAEVFKALLDMRKEIAKNIKDEIELRRKIKIDNKVSNIDELLNISSIVEKIDKMRDNKAMKLEKIKTKINNDIPSIEEILETAEAEDVD